MWTLWNFQHVGLWQRTHGICPGPQALRGSFLSVLFCLQSTEKFERISGHLGCRVSVTYALLTALYLNIILLGSHRFRILETDLEALYYNPGFSGRIVLPGCVVMGAPLSHDVGGGGARFSLFPPTGTIRHWAIRTHTHSPETSIHKPSAAPGLMGDSCDDNAALKARLQWVPPPSQEGTRVAQRCGPTWSITDASGLWAILCGRVGVGHAPLHELKAAARGGERHPSSPWQSNRASFEIIFCVYVFYCFGWLAVFSHWGVTLCSSPPVSFGGRGTDGQWPPSALHVALNFATTCIPCHPLHLLSSSLLAFSSFVFFLLRFG